MRGWFWLRLFLIISWLLTTIRVTIPDYGYQYSLFENLAFDPTGWLHEVFYITVFFGCALAITYFWQYIDTQRRFNALMVAAIKRIEKVL